MYVYTLIVYSSHVCFFTFLLMLCCDWFASHHVLDLGRTYVFLAGPASPKKYVKLYNDTAIGGPPHVIAFTTFTYFLGSPL